MGTLLQKELAQNIIKNATRKKRLNKKELIVSSGYSEISAESSAKLILEQKGVQEELENLGFDPESAKTVVKRILTKGKEENQLKAADMIFKVSGEYAPEKHLNINIPVPIYGGNSTGSIQGHDSNKEDISTKEEDPRS